MITIQEATTLIEKKLNSEKRVIHSLNVAEIMKSLARRSGEEETLWYLTGLLHDIDLPRTINDLTQHGLLAVGMLDGLLPEEGIEAIRTHEVSTGLRPKTLLGRSLIFADMFEIMARTISLESLLDMGNGGHWDDLRNRLPEKLYHIGVIEQFYGEQGDLEIPREKLNLDYL